MVFRVFFGADTEHCLMTTFCRTYNDPLHCERVLNNDNYNYRDIRLFN